MDPQFNKNVPNQNGTVNVTETYWTDMFLYWVDNQQVKEGSLIRLFSDISKDRAQNTKCYMSFLHMRDIWNNMTVYADAVTESYNWTTKAYPGMIL